MNWVPIATTVTTIAVPVLGLIGGIWLKRLSRRTDEAVAKREEATGKREEATAHKTDVEAKSTEVDIARQLLDDVREMYAEQRQVNENDKVKHAAELATMEQKVKSVEANQLTTDRKLTVLLAGLAAHQPWDDAAYAAMTAITPGYPPPPPIDSTNGSGPR